MRILMLCIFLMLTFSLISFGQWSTDPAINTPVCINSGDQGSPTICYAGDGCSIITWLNATDNKIYSQKLNAAGEKLWGENGVLIFSTFTMDKYFIIVDESNNFIIASHASKKIDNMLYDFILIQKLSDQGVRLWGDDGISLNINFNHNYRFDFLCGVVPDKNNGCLVLFNRQSFIEQGPMGETIKRVFNVDRIGSNGQRVWSSEKMAIIVGQAWENQYYAGHFNSFFEDDNGGAFITYWSTFNKKTNLYVAHVNADGQLVKDNIICDHDSLKENPVVTTTKDGAGGAIIVWEDQRGIGLNPELYAQRINQDLVPQWPHNGIVLAASDEYNQYISSHILEGVPVQSGGAVIVWEDADHGYHYHNRYLRAQRITIDGQLAWGPKGKTWQYCWDNPTVQRFGFTAINDLHDNFIFTETLSVEQEPKVVRSRKLAIDGTSLWEDNWDHSNTTTWNLLCSNINSAPEHLATTPDGYGGAISVWVDNRNGNKDIYAQQMNANRGLGSLPFPLNNESVQTVAVDPYNVNLFYIGTSGLSTAGSVYITRDNGLNWENIVPENRIESIAIDPKNSNILYVATFNNYVYKSTDSGRSWYQLKNGLTVTCFRSIAVDPTDTRIIYAGGQSGNFYKSIDSGNSWIQKNNGLKTIGNDFRPVSHSIAIDPTNNTILYAGTYLGIFKSIDGAENWTKIADYNTLPIIIDPEHPHILYAACDERNNFRGMIKSTDAGKTWFPIGPAKIRVFDLAIDPKNSNNIYAASMEPGGVWQTTDAGVTWNCLGYENTMFRCVALNSNQQPELLYAGASEGGVFKISPEKAPVFQDNFNDNQINSTNWKILSRINTNVAEQNQRLEFFVDDYAEARVESKYLLHGDFDITTDFNISVNTNGGNGLYMGVFDAYNNYTITRHYNAGWRTSDGKYGHMYLSNFDGDYQSGRLSTTATDTSGKIRLTRVGNNITSYFWRNGQWIQLLSKNGSIKDLYIGLSISTYGGTRKLKGSMDNFKIIKGELIYPPTTVPIESELLPTTYRLEQNYPNPFNPVTQIRYQIPQQTQVLLKIYDILGREVKVLANGMQSAGYYTIFWDGRDNQENPVTSGIYLYSLKAANFTSMKKLILMK